MEAPNPSLSLSLPPLSDHSEMSKLMLVLKQHAYVMEKPLHILKTVYRLTRSDIKTVMLPILTFGLSVVGWTSFSNFLKAFVWLLMVLIEFNLSNQTYGNAIAEDLVNKPYRPIPSGLMTVKTARRIRYVIPFINCALSLVIGGRLAVLCSLALTVIDTVHNDMEISRYWWGKCLFASGCYPCGELGTMAVLQGGSHLDVHQIIAVVVSGLVNVLTIHSQDFPDVVGDKANGRLTLPILYPTLARASIPVVLALSSLGTIAITNVHPVFAVMMIVSGIITSMRYIFVRTPEREMPSFVLYAVWLCSLHACLSNLKPSLLLSPHDPISIDL